MSFYDSVLLPVLTLAEQDRRLNALDDSRIKFINESVRELVEDVNDASFTDATEAVTKSCATIDAKLTSPLTITCIPVRDEADELAAAMLVQILERQGHAAQVLPKNPIAKMFEDLERLHPDVLCVSALHPLATGQSRPLCKQLRQHCPNVTLIMGLWEYPRGAARAQERVGITCADFIGTSLEEVVRSITTFQATNTLSGTSPNKAPSQPVEAVS